MLMGRHRRGACAHADTYPANTHLRGAAWACLDVCILQTVVPIVAPPHLMRSTRNSQPSCVQAGLIWLPMLPEPPGRRNRQALQALDAFCQSGALPRRQLHWPSEQQLCTAFWHAPRQRRGARAHVRLDGEDAQAALAQPAQHAQHGRRVRAAVVGPEVVLHLGAGRSRRSVARDVYHRTCTAAAVHCAAGVGGAGERSARCIEVHLPCQPRPPAYSYALLPPG